MRIQNNITAMNTHRQYTINNDNVAKAAEKLSSGYRINRAGDDAAGLAISEKMRSQIRGLNMATKNSQDAISLVQTAEGALQETQNMLQRMNELAVQAATGTNQEIDRNALAKEFEQLKREINDVAEQTTFNNMKVLDGSLSYTGPERSAATAGITVTKPTPSEASASSAAGLSINTVAGKDAGEGYQAGTPAEFKATLTGSYSLKADSTGNAGDGGTVSLEITVGGKKGTITSDANTGTTALTDKDQIAALFDGKTVEIDGVTYQASADGASAEIKFEATSSPKDLDVTTTAPTIAVTASTGSTAGTSTGAGVTDAVGDTKPENAPTKEQTVITGDISSIKIGDTLTIAGNDVLLDENNWVEDASLTDLETLIKANATGVDVEVKDDALLITAQTAGKNDPPVTSLVHTPAPPDGAAADTAGPVDVRTGKYTMEFDIVKMREGDTFDFTATKKDGSTVTAEGITYSGETAEAFAQKVAKELNDAGIEAKGNAIIGTDIALEATFSGDDAEAQKASWGTATKEPNAMMIQVGALENEQLAISIDSMNTAGLGLDNINLDSQVNSGKAITAVRDAINQVSDQRATLGAMQNRLEHKIANLKVSSENLSAAESRIRDVDMASEMTNFTKNNILSQAATAMLAQANSLPQNVLSLLG